MLPESITNFSLVREPVIFQLCLEGKKMLSFDKISGKIFFFSENAEISVLNLRPA